MAVSEAQKKASKKYFDNNYKQVKLSMPIKEAEALEAIYQAGYEIEFALIKEASIGSWSKFRGQFGFN